MNKINNIFRQIICVSFAFTLICGCVDHQKNSLIKVLILSGRNNHEWQKTTPPDNDFRMTKEQALAGNGLSWKQSDTTLSLVKNTSVIWQYNFNNRLGKPYFHPLAVNNSTLTCVSPPDHPWHIGLWFSWKFINGVNYWEYLDDFKSEETGYKSAGITKLQKIDILKNPDFSSDIRMELHYHPADGDVVMTEKRNIHISSPLSNGSYFIDHENIFNPLIDEVVLDRTPIEGEPVLFKQERDQRQDYDRSYRSWFKRNG